MCLVLRSTGLTLTSATVLEVPIITRVMSISSSASGTYVVTLSNYIKRYFTNIIISVIIIYNNSYTFYTLANQHTSLSNQVKLKQTK